MKKYKCFAFDVGADPVSAQIDINKFNITSQGRAIFRPKINKSCCKRVEAAWYATPTKKTTECHHPNCFNNTIIIMLILVGVVLNLTLGEHGIFKTA